MAQITKLFTKGLDTDTAPHLQDKESYSSAMNVHISLGSLLGVNDGTGSNLSNYNIGGDMGVLEPFAGNTDWTYLFDTIGLLGYNVDGAKCIGYAVDDTESISNDTRFFYMFIYTPQYGSPINPANSWIVKVAIKYDYASNVNTISVSDSSVLLSGTWVLGPNVDNLGFLDTYFVSARVSGNQLIWTDGVNPVRYVNVTTDYLVNNPTIAQLSLITEPPYAPLAPLREWIDSDPMSGTYGQIFTTGDPAYGSTVQKVPYQATYRITNTDNFTSVLAPYSFTSLPARQEDIDSDAFVGNRITVIVPKNQVFPSNTQIIDIVFKNLQSGVNSIVRKFDINDQTVRNYYIAGTFGPYNYTDAQAIAAHNDAGNPFQLYVNGWSGSEILETIDAVSAAKQFDSMPISSKSLEIASNRLFLANNLEGYNATTTPPAVTIDTTSYLYTTAKTNYPNAMDIRVIAISTAPTSTGIVNRIYFAVMVRDTTANKNYSFNKEIGFPSWVYSGATGRDVYSNTIYQYLPQRVSIEDLTLMKSQSDPVTNSTREDVMYELNPDYSKVDWSTNSLSSTYTLTLRQKATAPYTLTSFYSKAPYKGPSNQLQAFMPNASYDYGIQFYDQALRKSGVTKIGTFNTPFYNPNSRSLLEKVSITMPGGAQLDSVIPDWAYYYSITMSKNNKASSFVSFVPSIIKFAYKDQNNLIVYNNITKTGEVIPTYSYYGLAISLSELSKLGLGYSFANGDICELNIYDNIIGNTLNISAPILTQQDGYVICLVDQNQINKYVSSQSSTVSYNLGSGYIMYPGVSSNNAYYQSEIYVTLYTPQADSKQLYEVSSFGLINRGFSPGTHEFGNFFDTYYFGGSTSCFLIGDTYTQSRNGSGSLVGLSTNTYDKGFQFWVENISRLCPYERIGQKDLTNQIKWSNVRIPNSNYNGMATFDALDVTDVDSTVGPITSIILSSKEANLASRLVILCNSGSFIGLIGQAQIYSQDQTTAFLSSAPVIGTIQPITGQWGCISPQGVISYKGMVFWADALNREIIQLAGDGATPISQQKAGFLWNQVFRNLSFNDDTTSAKNIKIGINPYTSEIFVTCPNNGLTPAQFPADSGENRINQYIPDKNVSYVYNYQLNRWIGAYEDNPDQWIRVGDDVFSVGHQYAPHGLALYKEFDNTPGHFFQTNNDCWIAFPVSEGYPATLEPLSVILMGQLATTRTVVYARDSSSTVNNNLTQVASWGDSNYNTREGEKFAPVLRNRLSNNAGQSQVLTISPLVTGSGYLTAPLVTIGPPAVGGGTQATATAVLTGGSVTSYIITNPGTGYTSVPSITVAPPPSGTTATATITVGVATNNTYDYQGVKGDRIRSKTPWVQVTFPSNQQINFQGARVEVKPSSGH